MHFIRNLVLLSFLVATGQVSSVAVAMEAFPKKLVFSLIEGTQTQIEAAKTLTKAYGNLGISVDYLTLPARRALEFSDSGQTDGEVFRIKTITNKYKNLRRIPTPIMFFQGMAYSLKDISIDNWRDMQPYRIGIIRGVVWSERGAKGLNVVRLDTNEALFDKLLAGGVDIVVGTSFSMEREIQKRDLNFEIYNSKPLMQFKVYHFLHVKHETLVEPVNREIRKIMGNSFSQKVGAAE